MKRLAIAVLCASGVALAQGPGGHPPGPFGEMHVMGMHGMKPGQVVTGAPFSGQEVTTETQTLANGTHITNTMTAQFYRDASGRTRIERTLSKVGPWSTGGQPSTMIEISDPVAGVRYFLDPAKQTGVKETLPPAGTTASTPRTPRPDSAQVTTTSLGSQTIQGLTATGTLNTRVIPAGQMGNDQPISVSDERWYSPDLQLTILTKHSDPRMGEVDSALQNISRAAPDASLFQVPAGSYTLTTRTAEAGHRGHGGPAGPEQ